MAEGESEGVNVEYGVTVCACRKIRPRQRRPILSNAIMRYCTDLGISILVISVERA